LDLAVSTTINDRLRTLARDLAQRLQSSSKATNKGFILLLVHRYSEAALRSSMLKGLDATLLEAFRSLYGVVKPVPLVITASSSSTELSYPPESKANILWMCPREIEPLYKTVPAWIVLAHRGMYSELVYENDGQELCTGNEPCGLFKYLTGGLMITQPILTV
jgi:hypothetical protein